MAAKRAKKAKKKAKAKRAVVKVRRSSKAVKRSKTRKPAKAKAAKRAKAKAPARKAKKKKASRKTARKEAFGEGSYTASREFREEQTDFVKKDRARIPAMAKEAEKELEGPQSDELQRAEEETRSRAHEDQAAE